MPTPTRTTSSKPSSESAPDCQSLEGGDYNVFLNLNHQAVRDCEGVSVRPDQQLRFEL